MDRASRLRLTARILGALVGAAWLVVIVGGILGGDEQQVEGTEWQGVALGVLVVVAVVSTVGASVSGVRWAWAVVACGVALCAFALLTAGRNQWLAVLVAGVPWLVVGGLFLAADAAGRGGGQPTGDSS